MYRVLSIFPPVFGPIGKGLCLVLQKSQSGGFLDRCKGGGCSVMVSRGMILVGAGVVGRDGVDVVGGWAGVAMGVSSDGGGG